MKKIKVCHVVSRLHGGGVESFIYNYCSRLNSDKYEFHILYQGEAAKKNYDEFIKIGFKLKQIPSKRIRPIKNYIETKKYLKENNIDIVHCHMTLMNFIPLCAARKVGIKKRICHSHNADFRRNNFVISFIEKIIKSKCIKEATDLIACGNDAGRYLYGSKKFIIINNAIEIKKFLYSDKARTKIRTEYHIRDDEILIGNVGRFTAQKNQLFLIDVFNEIHKNNDKYKLILIGNGENLEKAKYMVDFYKLNDCVIFTGIISNVNEYYSAFDSFVLPSLYEGLCIALIEAQVSGLPCVVSKNISFETKKTDLVQFVDLSLPIEEWAKIIINSKIEKRINYDKKIIDAGFDIDNEINKLDNIYSGC